MIQYLSDFEKEIAQIYETGVIKAPIHLRNGNEEELLYIFNKHFNEGDIVYSSWASHLHALLAKIPREKVKQAILDGKSITLCFPEHNFYSSAIVGGSVPIAVGHAFGLKKAKSTKKVLCFLGDMTFATGIASESIRYAIAQELPIIFIVEDNGKSVGTPTESTLGYNIYNYFLSFGSLFKNLRLNLYKDSSIVSELLSTNGKTGVIHYSFQSDFPHSGIGKFVSF